MAATKKITQPIKAIVAGIEAAASAKTPPIVETELDPTQICRDESCNIIEVHAAHQIMSARGAPPKKCPVCLETIPRGQGARCDHCGWDRRGQTFARRKKKGESDA